MGKAITTGTIDEVISLLEQEYGPRQWKADGDPVTVLVGTILSQNTSDVNSHRALHSLISTFASWEAVIAAPVESVSYAIRSGGLARIKAARIKQVLSQIKQEQGRIDLDSLYFATMPEAKEYLMHLPGVGPKTASCVLLFSLGKPCMPVDTHVFRVSKRLGLINTETSVAKAHEWLQQRVPPGSVYQFHLHMIEHGRKVCYARRPRCGECVLRKICHYLRYLQG
jgi:endonuclease-3